MFRAESHILISFKCVDISTSILLEGYFNSENSISKAA